MALLSNRMMPSKDKQQTEEIAIEKNIVIDASPEVIFKAIKDKERKQGEYECVPEGTIIEFIPNKKVSYTWRQTNIPDFPNTVVTWELEEMTDNKTQVKLLHTGFESSELSKQHDEGWSYFLNRLQSYCKK